MSWKVLVGLAMLWFAGVGLDALTWGGYFATRTGTTSMTVGQLFSPPIATATDIFGIVSGLVSSWDWIVAWFGLLTWDFTFFDGNLQVFRYLMILISLGIIYGVVQAWIRGVRA